MAIVNLTNALANELLMSVINDVNSGTAGTVKVYTTPMPSSPDDAPTGTLLSTHNLSDPPIAALTVSTTSWSGSVSTYTITGHTLTVGARVVFSGFDPVGYDGEYTVTAAPSNTIDVAETSDPGAYISGSDCLAIDLATVSFDTIADDTSADAGGDPIWARIADSAGNAVVDVDAGVGSEFLVFNTGTISINANVAIDSLTLTV